MFRTVVQPSTHCGTGHPIAQLVIPLHNQTRFLPRSKPLTGTEVYLHAWGYLAAVKTQKRHTSVLPPPLMNSTRISVYSAKFNTVIARELHVKLHHQVAFRQSCCTFGTISLLNRKLSVHLVAQPGSCQIAWLHNRIGFRPFGCTTR